MCTQILKQKYVEKIKANSLENLQRAEHFANPDNMMSVSSSNPGSELQTRYNASPLYQ